MRRLAVFCINAAVVFAVSGLVCQVWRAAQRCPCPAPDGECVMPCAGCCDVQGTPEIEPCPCDPTAVQ